MQSSRGLAVFIVLMSAAACGQPAPAEPPENAPAATIPGHQQPPQAAAPTGDSPLKDLAGALGLSGPASASTEGLVPGGDCPTPAADVSSEIEAQANAAVP
ncbi:MAG TPA: hypothetical protein VF491_10480, partial [Vicinamibacterales bacterium]